MKVTLELAQRIQIATQDFWWSSPLADDRSIQPTKSPLLNQLAHFGVSQDFCNRVKLEAGLKLSCSSAGLDVWWPDRSLQVTCKLICQQDVLWAGYCFVKENMVQDPAHDLMHVLRVATYTRRLGEMSALPDTKSVLAALLHDVVNVKKGSAEAAQASASSAQLAERFLADQGMCEADASDICAAITTHSYSCGLRPSSPLGACLQDADRLDALGAIGVLRLLHVGHRLGATLFDPKDPWATSRPVDDKRYILDHVIAKLRDLPKTLTTDAAKRIGAKRQTFLMAFFEKLVAEQSEP